MKKITITFLSLIFIVSNLFSQLECGTVEKTDKEMEAMPWWGNNQYLEEVAQKYKIFEVNPFYTNKSALINEIPASNYKVPIQFWVYTDDNWNNNGMDEVFIQQQLDELNEIYLNEGTQIQFYRTCEIIYINNDNYLYASEQDQKYLIKHNFKEGVINVHYVRNMKAAGVFWQFLFKEGIFINQTAINDINNYATLAHEIGHYFSLEHTHRNYDKGKCRQESVSRSRHYPWWCVRTGKICEKSGDGFCDTPADPKLNSSKMSGCTYTANEKDNWDDTYSPDVTNIMSYAYPKTCRTNFSNSQISAMVDKLISRHYGHYFEPVERYYFDKYEPDNFYTTARNIPLNTLQHHTFHWTRQNDHEIRSCDVDWLKFYVPHSSNGSLFQIVTDNGILEDTDTEIWLYSENDLNNPIAYDDNSNGNGYSSIVQNLSSGNYFIKVKYKTEPPFNTASDYTIQVKECAPKETCVSGIVHSGEIKVYYAIDKLTAPCPGNVFVVEAGAEVIFVSEKEIHMQDGFVVEHGGKFKTVIGPIGEEACLNNELLKSSIFRIKKVENINNEISDNYENDTDSLLLDNQKDNKQVISNLTIYPNPSNGQIKVKFKLEKEETISLSIHSLCGTNLKQVLSNKKISKGNHIENIDISYLTKGVYLCRIRSKNLILTEKIIIE